MEIGESFFGKNNGKVSHWKTLTPKSIYDVEVHCKGFQDYQLPVQ
jgi:hypothetical protein